MKTDKSTVNQRIKNVAIQLIRGRSREEVVLYCSVNWSIGERQADNYIKRAKSIVEKSVEKRIEYDYAKSVRRLDELYKLCMDKEDYKTALSVNKELNNLQGLFKQQLEHSGNIKFICSIPD